MNENSSTSTAVAEDTYEIMVGSSGFMVLKNGQFLRDENGPRLFVTRNSARKAITRCRRQHYIN